MALDTTTFAGSSNLASGSYDDETQELTVEFRSGETYAYRNVPQGIWAGLKGAGSAGSYFHRQVRSRFAGRRL